MLAPVRVAGGSVCRRAASWRIGCPPAVPFYRRVRAMAMSTQQRPQTPAPAAAASVPSVRGGKQTLDYTALCACVHELRAEWVPSKVEEVVQPDAYTLSLRLRTPLRQGWLHLSWHPAAARLAVGGPPPRGAASEAFSLAAVASQHLRGLVLTAARLPRQWERVAELSFGPRPGDAPARLAYCEVMAKYSNVVLTDGSGTVLAAGHQVGGKQSSLRTVQQGRPYALPPAAAGGVPPSVGETGEVWRSNVTRAADLVTTAAAAAAAAAAAVDGDSSSAAPRQRRQRAGGGIGPVGPTFAGGCVRAYQGVSPALVEELCAIADVAPGTAPADLADSQWTALHTAWRAWLDRVDSGSFAATLDETAGRFSVLGSYPTAFDSTHEMLEAYYTPLQASELHTSLHQRLTAAAGGALKKARGRVIAFRQQLDSAAAADGVQRTADIIMANVYRIEEGAKKLETEDWDTGAPLTIPLDPTKSAVEQAEGLYKRARKLRRAVGAVGPLLEAAEQEVEYLEQVESEIAQLARYSEPADLAALTEVRDELVEAKIIKPPPDAALAAKAAAKGRRAAKRASSGSGGSGTAGGVGSSGFRRFLSPAGLTILVGRNNKQNDVLSHQVANPQDLWMHVRGLPGSHVLLRVEPGAGEPGDADVAAAADLAAWFSKARASGKVEVIVTRAEHVRKLKGGKPGQVLLAKEDRVVMARPDSSLAAAAGET